MAIRNIVQVGDSVLRKRCFEVTEFNTKLFQLLDDMKDTLIDECGAGLAAPQVGILRRAVIINLEEGYFELINPEIVSVKGAKTDYEGCLSIRGKKGMVTRPTEVKVKAFNRYGKAIKLTARDFFARAVCHELDHLDGILYIDKAESLESDEK